MEDKLNRVLNEQFNHSYFKFGQKEAIQSVLHGNDTLVVLPTGSGKSICYQLMPFVKEGTTIIISPLLSLMQDQANKLRSYGIKEVCALNSLLTKSERNYIFRHLNKYKFILLSPEMLSQQYVIDQLAKININLLVVDEAHCVTQWGMDFRPDYLDIATFRPLVQSPPIMALTATATRQVQKEIKQLLNFDKIKSKSIITSVDRPEIKLYFEQAENKDERVLDIINTIQKPGIIYFSSKKKADEIANLLIEELNINAESYHADKESQDKITIQNQFLDNQLQVICATSAFGMGINKQDIKFVMHYHMPASPEMYLQEIGRCSRNGEDGIAIMLYKDGDENIQRFLKQDSIPDVSTIQYVYQNFQSVHHQEDIQYKLIRYFYLNNYSLEETIQFFNDRKNAINHKIHFLRDLILTNKCKREVLLGYFDESKQNETHLCCDSCNENLLDLFNDESPVSNSFTGLKSVDNILKSLYNLDVTT